MIRDFSYPPYDFYDFLNEIKDLDLFEIIKIGQESVYSIEGKSYGVKGAVKMRELGGPKFAAQIKGLLFLLGNGVKPNGLSDGEFQATKIVISRLVEKGIIKDTMLEVYKENPK